MLERLPDEIFDHIGDYVTTSEATAMPSRTMDASMDPSIPPADGSSPLLGLPRELRRAIFAYVLPPEDKIVEPYDKLTKPEAAPDAASVASAVPAAPIAHAAPGFATVIQTHIQWLQSHQPTRHCPAKKNRKPVKVELTLAVGDALILCKSITAEILITLYEERTFALNVYDGIRDGGIEFLNSGRQRLQYREHFTFVRFKRFEDPDDPFGFSRIKRLLIRVYPATEAGRQRKSSRHDAVHTHFMLRALVNLLKQNGEHGLNQLCIRFVEPQNTSWSPHPWQNTSKFSVRNSSIHGISTVEVILRGLLELRQVQTAVCELPPGLYRDTALAAFVDRLQGVITCKLHSSTIDDEITTMIEGARDMLDNWIHLTMFSTKASRAMTGLTDADFMNVENADAFDYSPDEDGFYETPVDIIEPANESQAVVPPPQLRDVYEKRITTTDATYNEDKDAKLHTSESESKPKPGPSSSTKNDARPARTNSTRRSARKSPLTSASRESSGGASLFGIISSMTTIRLSVALSVAHRHTLTALHLLLDQD
ncbi:hypothetical protein KCU62_g2681, partial [Aureobasidium sp. EXF-3399]